MALTWATLLQEKFSFSQDRLLTPNEFVTEGVGRGRSITLDLLRQWHENGRLLPLFFIDEAEDAAAAVQVPADRGLGRNVVGDVIRAAHDGRLRDGRGVSAAVAPLESRDGPGLRSRWIFSEWQLLDLRRLLGEPMSSPAGSGPALERARARTTVLCHTAWWSLPGIVQVVKLEGGSSYSWGDWTTPARAASPADSLAAVGWTGGDLQAEAEQLLLQAHWDDPNRDWLRLVRHMTPRWWRLLHGLARDAIERRVAAEVLLDAHARLVADGKAEPLPDLRSVMAWHPLHDRLRGPELERTPLDSALSAAGLSPHPRAVLLVEGESEAAAARLLLAELVTDGAEWVRVHALHGAGLDPKQVSRYAVAPLPAPAHDTSSSVRELARPPAALVIHVDPENRWATEEKAEREREQILDELAREVRSYGVEALRDDLASLVHLRLAPAGGFEFANFTDLELAEASWGLALRERPDSVDGLAARFAAARATGSINSILNKLRISKPRLAAALGPVLVDRLAREVAGEARTPIIGAVLLAVEVAERMPRGSVLLRTALPEE